MWPRELMEEAPGLMMRKRGKLLMKEWWGRQLTMGRTMKKGIWMDKDRLEGELGKGGMKRKGKIMPSKETGKKTLPRKALGRKILHREETVSTILPKR